MKGWMDGWMNGQTDGWMDGRKGQADRWTLFYSTLPAETAVQKFCVWVCSTLLFLSQTVKTNDLFIHVT